MNRLFTLYILILTQGISLIGSRMTTIGIGIWLYQQNGKVTYLLLIPFFNELPSMLAGSLAGVWIDYIKRKYILIFSDLGQAFCTVFLFFSLAFHSFQLWHLYLVVILQGCFTAFQSPAADAVTTLLTEKEHRERVNAVKEILFPFAGILAPILSGLVYGLTGIQGVILIDLATFFVSVTVLFFLHIPELEKNELKVENKISFFKEFKLGLKYLLEHRSLLILVLYFSFTNFLLNGPLELAIPYLLKITGNQLKMSMYLTIMNLGALSGALILSIWGGTALKINTLMPGMLLNGFMMILFGFLRTQSILIAVLILMMLPLPICNAVFISLLQTKTPPDLQGRIFAVVSQLSMIGTPISFIITGPLVDYILEPSLSKSFWRLFTPVFGNQPGSGMGLLLSFTGIAIIVSTIICYRLPKIKNLELLLPDYK